MPAVVLQTAKLLGINQGGGNIFQDSPTERLLLLTASSIQFKCLRPRYYHTQQIQFYKSEIVQIPWKDFVHLFTFFKGKFAGSSALLLSVD